MKLFVGLGNPGDPHINTRHNAGFMLLDYFADKENLSFENDKYTKSLVCRAEDFILAKPQTFMNSSGEAVSALIEKFKIELSDLYVVHDDLDILLSEYKIQFGRGPKVHNGILSIEEHLKSVDFWRVRIGVDNRDPANRMPGDAYVMDRFEKEELELLEKVYPLIFLDLKKLL